MMTYHWPGNVRELENTLRKLTVLRDPDLIARDLLAKASRKPLVSATVLAHPVREAHAGTTAAEMPEAPILEQVTKAKQQAEKDAILAALNSTRWNRKQAALLLKTDYKALLYKMKKLGVVEDSVGSMPANASETPSKVLAARGQ
jgi:two-component system response regulator AtoC